MNEGGAHSFQVEVQFTPIYHCYYHCQEVEYAYFLGSEKRNGSDEDVGYIFKIYSLYFLEHLSFTVV